MAVPMIKAIQQTFSHGIVDVLIGTTPDDFGAFNVLSKVVSGNGKIYAATALERHYDVAVFAIPYDGRWKNGIHFNADKVMDGRPRPGNSQVLGFSSWVDHEVEYQMENAYQLGFNGSIPDTSFFENRKLVIKKDYRKIYFGLGYKKDIAGFWKVKHWGNENYARLARLLLDFDKDLTIVTTGDIMDNKLSMMPVKRLLNGDSRFQVITEKLEDSFKTVKSCTTYIGNDTGMMHVASSMDLNVIGLFFMEHAFRKNRPWKNHQCCIEAVGRVLTPDEVFAKYLDTITEQPAFAKEYMCTL